MLSLAELPELLGFFSYSREDDEDSGGALSALRDRVQRELRGQLGRSLKNCRLLWQDKDEISVGKGWENEIRNAIARSVFFIPIITPTVVKSRFCTFELHSFLARERELCRTDLVFPILYIRVPNLDDVDLHQSDPLLSLIAERQYVDWCEFRHRDVNSPEVKVKIERFCSDIVKALREPWKENEERQGKQTTRRRSGLEPASRAGMEQREAAAQASRPRKSPLDRQSPDQARGASTLDESASPSNRAASVARVEIPQRWVHETTEDEFFTGRSEELNRLDRLSADPEVRVIAITGMGGLGKTSLVAHWLKKQAGCLTNSIKGVLFWSVYADRDVKALFQAIVKFAVDELGVASPRGKIDGIVALSMLRNTAILLVIDGLELLQDVPSSTSYGALLINELRDFLGGACRTRHPSLVIVTSRFPFADLRPYLGRGLRTHHLERLSASEGAQLLATCDVGGTHAEREAVSMQFNGHPLGLRLLALTLAQCGDRDASRLVQRVFDAAELSDDGPLERKLKHLMEFYERGMPRSQVALIGIVSFFRSLAPKRAILALARHLPAVAKVTESCSDAELEDALAALSHQHLLICDPAQENWSCHPILRDHFRQSLLGWAPGIATGAANILTARPSPDPQDIRALEPILAAVELLLDANDFVGADQLFRERLSNGRIFRKLAAPSEGMRCALGFVRDDRRGRCERVLGKRAVATYANTVGVSARQTGEFEFGTKYLEECTAIYDAHDQKIELSSALQNLAGLLIILGRLVEAERRAREAVVSAREAPASKEAEADAVARGALTYLGTILGKRGRVDDALAAFKSATELERRVEGLFSRRGIRYADLLLRIGRVDEARRLTEANLHICVEKQWQVETAQCWSVLGEIALKEGLLDQADAQLAAAEGVFRSGHTISQMPRVLLARGDLERQRQNWEHASAAIEEALTLAAPRQMRLDQADALVLRARLQLDQAVRGDTDAASREAAALRAGDDCDEALHLARECGYCWAERDALVQLARSHESLGSIDRARSFGRDAQLLSGRLMDTIPPPAKPC